ncbi:MAG: 3-deoxy-D-manno-octulosonic acid transferase [Verrucomicrobia bacterium]|nr:3-deoxy-D-manno-octulosonic acid transferase [Verrucomicrobiota bacterium]MBS0646462.1 3-deoxy-D-manno-octulosonic acid transferase [Verrucomicrobiota bacterium]
MDLFKLGYDIALHLYALGMLPKIGWEAWRHGKYRKSFAARLGRGFPSVAKDERPLIWVHAVSLGETKAVAPLVEKLAQHGRILFSTATETGYQEALKSVKASQHVFLPYDLPYIIRPIVRRIRPSVVILVESDFWLNFQDAAHEVGAKVVLVNGKISERSFRRFAKFPALARRLLGSLDYLCVQGELYQQRFCALGLSQDKVVITGNLKLDAPRLESQPLAKKEGDFILTLGSTHDPEERLWLEAIKTCPNLKVYLVPRHPERFESVASLLEASGLMWGKWSQQADFSKVQVILVDAMGVLQRCYQISDLAFVGGSLTQKVGGHNILEPSVYGVPVLYGPYMWGQRDFLELMQRYQAGCEVTETTLSSTLCQLMQNSEARQRMGAGGKQIFAHSSGALSTTYQQVLGVNPQL